MNSLASTRSPSAAAARDLEADPAVLVVTGLAQSYGGRTVLELPEWTVRSGQHSIVLGPSGCGKTTLLHLIAGLSRPSQGHLRVAGQDLSALAPAQLDAFRGKNVGIVLQRLHLIRALTVRDNLRLAQSLAGLPARDDLIDRLLFELGLGALATTRPDRLSQGEAQRVAIARAVINGPALILADEPTSALDDGHAEAVLRLLLMQAEASGATLLIATHDGRIKSRFSHRLELPARS